MANQSPQNRAPVRRPAPQKQMSARPAPTRAPRAGTGLSHGALIAVVALACALALAATWLLQPGLISSAEQREPALRISEVMAAASVTRVGDGGAADWIEVENISGHAVDLTGYALMRATRPAQAFVFPGGRLEAGGFAVIIADGDAQAQKADGWHAPFRLPASGDGLTLLDRAGNAADSVAVPALAKDQVYCLDADGAWQISDFPTPGEANLTGRVDASRPETAGEVVVEPGAVEITEVVTKNATFFPDEDGNYPDYIEVHNTTDAPVSLAGWSLSDNRRKLLRWQFPDVTLPADGYLAVHCSGQDRRDNPAHLHAPFKLSRDGDEVYLTDPDGVTTSKATVPALSADQAWSLTETGWSRSMSPTPGQPNTPLGADAAGESIRGRNSYGVYINEICASSAKTDDWIEIYNSTDQTVDLSGFGLSDNAGRPRKWQFPSGTTLKAGGYLGVYANGTNKSTAKKLCTGYRLSADGGYSVTLSDPNGQIFDRVFLPTQYQEMSYGRVKGKTEVRYFNSMTPGKPNKGSGFLGRAPLPVYSEKGGLYKKGDVLSVELKVPGNCRVYYTLDNTDPTESSTPYTGPITVDKTTILRTRVYGDGYMESFMDTQSYLYDVNNADGTVFVMSLVSDPYNLTSDEAGIMVKGPNATAKYPYGSMNKGANFWMDWEREAHIEVFNPDGSTLISQECGTKLHGQYSRAEEQKAFKVIARSKYSGSNRFEAAIFSKRPYTEYQSFLLRSSSEDGNKTRMRDAVMQSLAEGGHVMYQETEIGVLYIDGVYWGHYNLRERINTASICQFEGWEGEEDDLDLIKANTNVMQGSNATMEKLLKWVKSNNMNTDKAWKVINKAIDVQNYIEYMAVEMYSGNTDTLNVKRYRNPKRDGKWRWVLFDLDWAFHEDTNSVRRWLTPGGMGNMRRTDNTLFIACMKNNKFKDKFLTYLGKQMATTYSAKSVLAKIEAFYNKIEPLMPDQYKRWSKVMTAQEHREGMRKFTNYAKSRPYRMLQFLKYCEYMPLTKKQMEHYFGAAMKAAGVTYDKIKKP